MKPRHPDRALLVLLLLAACGGGGGDGGASGGGAGQLPDLPARRVSAATPVAAGCTGGSSTGTLYANAEVEPFVAAHANDGNHLVAAWQQDRWSDGGSRALVSAVSRDGGATWQRTLQPMSRCGGALAGAAGDFERVTDPWVDVGADGSVHLLGLAINGAALQPGSASAMLASRSTDGGRTWSAPAAINRIPGAAAFTPTLHVRADGLVGVMHYDLRSNTTDASTLLADAWLLSSRDGVAWTEAHVHGPFDMAAAPDARGLFLGDYQGLVSANRTDIFAPRLDGISAARESPAAAHFARSEVPIADAARWAPRQVHCERPFL